jgi:transcription elongation factor Elf1
MNEWLLDDAARRKRVSPGGSSRCPGGACRLAFLGWYFYTWLLHRQSNTNSDLLPRIYMPLIHYTTCPFCHSDQLATGASVLDHTVSHETFSIWQCGNCSLRFTQDVPDAGSIGPYYRSDNISLTAIRPRGWSTAFITWCGGRPFGQVPAPDRFGDADPTGQAAGHRCGTGAFAAYMQEHGWEVTGWSRMRRPGNGRWPIIRWSCCRWISLFRCRRKFDAITLWHVLEHVHDLHPYIEQLKTLLKRGAGSLSPCPIILLMMRRYMARPGRPMTCPGICIIFHRMRWKTC